MKNVPTKIIVHHSADPSPKDQLAKINEWHKYREFPRSKRGYFVGYHFLINKLGVVTQTRDLDEEGAHTKGQNFSSIGICLEGDFNQELPSPAQEKALGELLVRFCDQYGLTPKHIHPHRMFANKDCYGTNLTDIWAGTLYLQYKISALKKVLLWIQEQYKRLFGGVLL